MAGQQAAQKQVLRAVRSGRLVRLPCEVCGDPKTDAHHDDYDKPIDVRWLCRPHHKWQHPGRGLWANEPFRIVASREISMSEVKVLTTQEVAERLRVQVITVQRWLHAGKMKGTKLPGRAGWRVPVAEVEKMERGE